MRLSSLVAVMLLAASASASASAQDVPQPEARPAAEKMVCKSVPAVNSRIGRKRVCMTASQAKLEEERTRREADRATPPPGL